MELGILLWMEALHRFYPYSRPEYYSHWESSIPLLEPEAWFSRDHLVSRWSSTYLPARWFHQTAPFTWRIPCVLTGPCVLWTRLLHCPRLTLRMLHTPSCSHTAASNQVACCIATEVQQWFKVSTGIILSLDFLKKCSLDKLTGKDFLHSVPGLNYWPCFAGMLQRSPDDISSE